MSCPCNRTLIASPGCGTDKGYWSCSAYRCSLWHPLDAFWADLEPFLIMQVMSHWEHAALWPRSCQRGALTGILPGNLFLSHCQSDSETQGLFGVCNRLESQPTKNFLLTSVGFRAGSELIPMGGGWVSSPDTKEVVLSQGYIVQPISSLPKLTTTPKKGGSLVTYTGSKWSRSHWHWTCWGGVCEWPRSSGAGKGWCAPWAQTGSPAQQSHWDSQRCTWWWFAPRREWAQSTVFQYGKLWKAEF